MPRISFLNSSAYQIELDDCSTHPTGFWVQEALTAYERLVEAGAEVVVMTPDGRTPGGGPISSAGRPALDASVLPPRKRIGFW